MTSHHNPFGLAAALVVGLFSGSLQAAILEDDFEADTINAAPASWTLANSPTTLIVKPAPYQSPIGKRGDDRGLQVDNDPGVTFEAVRRNFAPQTGTFYLQFDYLGIDMAELHNLQIGDGGFANATPGRGISLTMSTTSGVTVGQWYRFTLTINVATGTYDLRLQSLGNTSSDTTTPGLPFVNAQAELDTLQFWFNTNTNGSGHYALDNVLLTTDPGELTSEVIPTILIEDDFEATGLANPPLGWILGASPTTFTVQSAAQSPEGGAGDNRGMRLDNDPNTSLEFMQRGFTPQSGTFHVQFDYRAFNLEQLHNLQIGDGNVGTNRAINLTMSTTSGVAVNTWYRFTLTIDVAADTYDVRVRSLEDDSLDTTTTGLAFANPQAELDLIRFWFNTSSAAGNGDFALDNILVTTDPDLLNPEAGMPQLSGFSYNPLTGASEVSFSGAPGTNWKLIAADDLDFANPDLDPVPLASATTGVLAGNGFTTDANGNATVQFNLPAPKSRNFIRAVRE